MADLSRYEISDIVDVLGGALVAHATDSLPQMPSYWTTSLARPTHSQMIRLKVLKHVIGELTPVLGAESVRQWIADDDTELKMSPAQAIRLDGFESVRTAARRKTSQA